MFLPSNVRYTPSVIWSEPQIYGIFSFGQTENELELVVLTEKPLRLDGCGCGGGRADGALGAGLLAERRRSRCRGARLNRHRWARRRHVRLRM